MQAKEDKPELSCAKCGSCSVVCPVFRVDSRESLTARGKMHLLATELADHPSAVFENLFSQCLLCGACEQVCPRRLPITDIVSRARSRFSLFYGRRGLQKVAARSVLARPGLLEGLVRLGISLNRIMALPHHSGLRIKLGLLEKRSDKAGGDQVVEQGSIQTGLSYFAGCFALHLQPSIAAATKKLLARCGQDSHPVAGQSCCGLAAWSAGDRDQARTLARNNIKAFASTKGPIITSCASCSSHLITYPDLFAQDDPWHDRARQFADRVEEFTGFFNRRLPGLKGDTATLLRVFYHDPCHLRFTENGISAPRQLLAGMGLQVVEPENGPSCCGQGGLFNLAYPELSERIFKNTGSAALAGQPDCITTTCSGCLMQYQQELARQRESTRVMHLAVLLAELLAGQQENEKG